MKKLCLILAVTFLAVVPFTRGALIANNGAPDGNNGYGSDLDPLPTYQGDSFTLGSAQIAQKISWWGAYAITNTAPASDSFTIQIFSITAGVPAVSPLISLPVGSLTRVDTGSTIAGYELYSYSTTISDTPLAAGDYLLSIFNDTTTDTNDDWYWATTTTGPAGHWSRFSTGAAWLSIGESLAFNIEGPAPIPEPTTVLFGVAIVAAMGCARRRVSPEG